MKPVFLILVDLSEGARRAASFAAQLAVPAGAHLVLLHVESIAVVEPIYGMMIGSVEYNTLEPDATELLTQLAEQLPVPTTVEMRGGVLAEVLEDMIGRFAPQLLVMSLAPNLDLLDHLLVNQALPALRDTGLPLLLIPAAAQVTMPLHHVVVAVDGEPFHLSKGTKALRPLLGTWTAEYTIVHVALPDTPRAAEMHQALTNVRASGLLPAGLTGHSYHINDSSRAGGVLRASADVQADLLVLIARSRSFAQALFHRSVTAEVVRRSRTPVLLLPAAEALAPTLEMAPASREDLDD